MKTFVSSYTNDTSIILFYLLWLNKCQNTYNITCFDLFFSSVLSIWCPIVLIYCTGNSDWMIHQQNNTNLQKTLVPASIREHWILRGAVAQEGKIKHPPSVSRCHGAQFGADIRLHSPWWRGTGHICSSSALDPHARPPKAIKQHPLSYFSLLTVSPPNTGVITFWPECVCVCPVRESVGGNPIWSCCFSDKMEKSAWARAYICFQELPAGFYIHSRQVVEPHSGDLQPTRAQL